MRAWGSRFALLRRHGRVQFFPFLNLEGLVRGLDGRGPSVDQHFERIAANSYLYNR